MKPPQCSKMQSMRKVKGDELLNFEMTVEKLKKTSKNSRKAKQLPKMVYPTNYGYIQQLILGR